MTAHQDGAVIDEVDGETDAAGVSVLINLPHETGEGGPVTLDVVAHKNTTFTDAQTGCVVTDTWDASRLAVPVDGVELTVEFTADEQQAVSSIECPPEVAPPTGEVGGAVGTPGATARATLPPTDTIAANDGSSPGSLAVIAALVGASAGLVVLVPRRRRAAVRVGAAPSPLSGGPARPRARASQAGVTTTARRSTACDRRRALDRSTGRPALRRARSPLGRRAADRRVDHVHRSGTD